MCRIAVIERSMAHGYTNIVELEMLRDASGDVSCANESQRADASTAAESSFEEFSRQHYASLLNFLRLRMPNDADAHDVAQESLTRLLRYRDTEPPAAWRPLMFRIARNLINEHYRRGQTRHVIDHVPLEGLELADPAPSLELVLVKAQQQAWLRAAILQLPDRCRQVYVLSRVDGLSHAQIASHCGISLKTVEKHLTKALATLCDKAGVWDSDAST